MSSYTTLDHFEIRHTKQIHDQILAHGYAHHTSVRETAERALHLHAARAESAKVKKDTKEALKAAQKAEKEARRLQQEVEKVKKAQEEALEAQIELQRLEKERTAQEEVQRQAKLAEDQERKRKAAEEETRRQQEAVAQAQRDQEAAQARRYQEAAAKAQNALQQQSVQPVPQPTKPAAATPPASTTENAPVNYTVPHPDAQVSLKEFARFFDQGNCAPFKSYATIHGNLKLIRRMVKDFAGSGDSAKVQYAKKCNELRRVIQTGVSQIQSDGRNSATVLAKIREAVKTARDITPPSEAQLFQQGRFYFVDAPEGADVPVATMLLYVLNSVSRSVIKQWVMEAGDNPKKAQAVTILALRLFCSPEASLNGKAMLDILLCKIYVNCPILFGARGDEATDDGKATLGWRQAKDDDGNRMYTGQGDKRKRVFVADQVHYARMKGIAAGFGAIALRYFKNGNNPCPPYNYWHALSRIMNCPPNEISGSQCVVLQGMIQGQIAQFIKFYGWFGAQALEIALVRFPEQWTISKESDTALKGSLQALAARVNRTMDPDLLQVEPIPGY